MNILFYFTHRTKQNFENKEQQKPTLTKIINTEKSKSNYNVYVPRNNESFVLLSAKLNHPLGIAKYQ